MGGNFILSLRRSFCAIPKNIRNILLFELILVCGGGVALHYVFEWSGSSVLVAPFVPVNESIWEHTKLVFFPAAVCVVVNFFLFGRKTGGYFYTAFGAIFAAVASIIAIHYTYSGIIGFRISAVDISLFFVAVLIFFYISARGIIKEKKVSFGVNAFFAALLAARCIAYFVLTFSCPNIPLFTDPTNGLTGIV